MLGLKVKTDCTLGPGWQTSAGISWGSVETTPVVANGVIYYADGDGGQLWAFDASTGRILWVSPALSGGVYTQPIVLNGRLYVVTFQPSGSGSGRLYAFGP
jgi:outer membrane protein assembly factor BamB